ncbi:MAG: response regulator [Lachnospiraceae bacterium]|nr:response regulator [Lachnospiraceae bacterium]
MLGAKNIGIEVAKDGEEAVNMFAEHADGYYDVILMDIHIPKMNGWEATKLIRNMPNGKEIPIFSLSADAFVEDKRKSIEAGMNGHITKPIDYKELEREVQRSLQ